MTDYNDGKWHGWNGGECPVDPLSEVECIYPANDMQNENPCWAVGFAGNRNWRKPFLFRVTKPAPPKPREWWLCAGRSWSSEVDARSFAQTLHSTAKEITHVREVIGSGAIPA